MPGAMTNLAPISAITTLALGGEGGIMGGMVQYENDRNMALAMSAPGAGFPSIWGSTLASLAKWFFAFALRAVRCNC